MPCNSYQGNDIGLHHQYEGQYESLANMLWRTLTIVFENSQYRDPLNPIPADVRDWWLKHKEWDLKRKKDESMKYRIVRLNNGFYRLEYAGLNPEYWFRIKEYRFLWKAKRWIYKRIKDTQKDAAIELGNKVNSVVFSKEV